MSKPRPSGDDGPAPELMTVRRLADEGQIVLGGKGEDSFV